METLKYRIQVKKSRNEMLINDDEQRGVEITHNWRNFLSV